MKNMSFISGNRKLTKLAFAMLLFLSHSLIAQNVTVSGTVTSDGIPLNGVNVIVKGTSNGQITDLDGNYSITALPTDTLVFSYLGFVTQEIVVPDIPEIRV